MRFPLALFFGVFFPLICFAPPNVVIGIYGDIHGNATAAEKVLDQMKAERVTHIIGTGDFIEWGGVRELDRMLKMISERTGVPPKNTYLMPGNWDHETSNPLEANAVLLKYGHLISPNYTGFGYLTIEGKRIMVSHFPQHAIPKEMLPEDRYLRRIPGQGFILDTMRNGIHPEPDAAFEIFAHTHIGGHFIDPVSGKTVINVGTLHEQKKSAGEPLAFALYHPNSNKISFFQIGTTEPVETVLISRQPTAYPDTKSSLDGCATLLKAVIKKNDSYYRGLFSNSKERSCGLSPRRGLDFHQQELTGWTLSP